jgi:hypothetical protein
MRTPGPADLSDFRRRFHEFWWTKTTGRFAQCMTYIARVVVVAGVGLIRRLSRSFENRALLDFKVCFPHPQQTGLNRNPTGRSFLDSLKIPVNPGILCRRGESRSRKGVAIESAWEIVLRRMDISMGGNQELMEIA